MDNLFVTPNSNWKEERERGNCWDNPVAREIFFSPTGTHMSPKQEHAAIQFCQGCPVQVQCLQYALDTNQPEGVWGGKGVAARRWLRKRYRRESA